MNYLRCFWRSRPLQARSSDQAARCGCPSPRTSAASSRSSVDKEIFVRNAQTRDLLRDLSFIRLSLLMLSCSTHENLPTRDSCCSWKYHILSFIFCNDHQIDSSREDVGISSAKMWTNRVQNAGEWYDEGIIPRTLHRFLQGFEQLVHGSPLASRCQAEESLGSFSSSRTSRAGLASGLRRFSSSRTAITSCRTTIVLTARWALLFAGRVLLVVLASRWLLAVTAHVIPYDPAV